MNKRIVVLISGSGSNLQAIIDAISAKKLHAEIALVVSNKKDAYGLERAKQAGITTNYFPLKPYKDAGKSRELYDEALGKLIQAYAPDLIVLAGWMHILSPAFLDQFPRRVINLHPALPGEYPGTHAIERAFDAFQRGEITRSGIMVHYAVPEVDAGDVIIQAEVPILATDKLEDFQKRIQATEHQVIVQAIALCLDKITS